MAISELKPLACTAGATAKSIKDFIDDTLADKEILERINYIEIADYQKDGDTVRGAIDLIYAAGASGAIVQPLLAGVPKAWYDVKVNALNNWKIQRPAGSDVDFVLIVGIGR